MYADFPGHPMDLDFLEADDWLKDSAVNALVTERNQNWRVSMVMAWWYNPMRFVCRFINTYTTQKKAVLSADLFCRTAQKDERGTLKINWNDWNICIN
jgi:hypothetical protein